MLLLFPSKSMAKPVLEINSPSVQVNNCLNFHLPNQNSRFFNEHRGTRFYTSRPESSRHKKFVFTAENRLLSNNFNLTSMKYGFYKVNSRKECVAVRSQTVLDDVERPVEKLERENYDAIVIGSGMGGLVTATQLAVKGARVLVLEKYVIPGGSSGFYKREGYTFDVGSSVMFGFSSEKVIESSHKACVRIGAHGDRPTGGWPGNRRPTRWKKEAGRLRGDWLGATNPVWPSWDGAIGADGVELVLPKARKLVKAWEMTADVTNPLQDPEQVNDLRDLGQTLL